MPRSVTVTRRGPDPRFSVDITLLPLGGGQVVELRLSEAEMVELAKALDLMCSDAGLVRVTRESRA